MTGEDRLEELVAEARRDGFQEMVTRRESRKGNLLVMLVAFRTATAERVRIVQLFADAETDEFIRDQRLEGTTVQECKDRLAAFDIRPGEEWYALS